MLQEVLLNLYSPPPRSYNKTNHHIINTSNTDIGNTDNEATNNSNCVDTTHHSDHTHNTKHTIV